MKKVIRKGIGCVYGKGTNDAPYPIVKTINGKRVRCPYYDTWKSMIRRCYCKKYQERVPTYKGCSVAEEWLLFTTFKAWMETQDWKGKQLDKDLLVADNKVYSADNCVFLSSRANNTLSLNKKRRGEYPVGVSVNPATKKFQSHGCDIFSKSQNLGSFDNIMDAHRAWQLHKIYILEHVRDEQKDTRAVKGFDRIIKLIVEDYQNGVITTTF